MRLSWILLAFTLSSCAVFGVNPKAARIEGINQSASEVRVIVTSLFPDGVESVSSNGRELVSKPFILEAGKLKGHIDSPDRYIAQIVILGDRRPFSIEVLVRHERRVLRSKSDEFESQGFDPKLSEDLAKRLKRELSKRRDDRNMIDDFRVY